MFLKPYEAISFLIFLFSYFKIKRNGCWEQLAEVDRHQCGWNDWLDSRNRIHFVWQEERVLYEGLVYRGKLTHLNIMYFNK